MQTLEWHQLTSPDLMPPSPMVGAAHLGQWPGLYFLALTLNVDESRGVQTKEDGEEKGDSNDEEKLKMKSWNPIRMLQKAARSRLCMRVYFTRSLTQQPR